MITKATEIHIKYQILILIIWKLLETKLLAMELTPLLTFNPLNSWTKKTSKNPSLTNLNPSNHQPKNKNKNLKNKTIEKTKSTKALKTISQLQKNNKKKKSKRYSTE